MNGDTVLACFIGLFMLGLVGVLYILIEDEAASYKKSKQLAELCASKHMIPVELDSGIKRCVKMENLN